MKASGLPGVRPRPSVDRPKEPWTACTGAPWSLRITASPCGMEPAAARTSDHWRSHSTICRATWAARSRLRAGRSASPPSSARSAPAPGTIKRAPAKNDADAPIASNANSDAAPDIRSSRPPCARWAWIKSRTRSFPAFRTSLIELWSPRDGLYPIRSPNPHSESLADLPVWPRNPPHKRRIPRSPTDSRALPFGRALNSSAPTVTDPRKAPCSPPCPPPPRPKPRMPARAFRRPNPRHHRNPPLFEEHEWFTVAVQRRQRLPTFLT